MSRKKLLLIAVPLIAILGLTLKFTVLAGGADEPDKKVEGTLVDLDPEFMINLEGGHFAKLNVTLLVDPASLPPTPGGEGAAGPIQLEQASLIRSIVTDRLTGLPQSWLLSREERHQVLQRLVRDIRGRTDTQVEKVFITDLSVS